MRDLENRADTHQLVKSFYDKIRKDDLLGPIFNGHIPVQKWPEHLDLLTDFWQMNLFGIPGFNGSPSQKHVQVDRNLKHTIEQKHFDMWVALWVATVDELFVGEVANKAKLSAERMAHGQYMAIWSNRPLS